jgi:hypothetical protein
MLCNVFLRNDHFGNSDGEDQEFWKTDVRKLHFEELHI